MKRNYFDLLISEDTKISEYEIRLVSDMESFVEKVQIISADYDDRAIELMKFMNSPHEEDDIQFSFEHMVFTKVGHDNFQFMFINNQTAVASLQFSKEQYEYFLSDVENIKTSTFCIDSKWAEQFLRKGVA